MKGSKTRKIVALMLIIFIIIATSNVFINKVSAATSMGKTVTLLDGFSREVNISIADGDGDLIDLDERYVVGLESFQELRFRVSVEADVNSRLVAVDYEGNEADILNNINLSPRVGYLMGVEWFSLEPVKIWVEDTGIWVFEYKMKELDIKNWGANVTELSVRFVCNDSDYDIMYDCQDRTPLLSFGTEGIDYDIAGLILDDVPPYMTFEVSPYGKEEVFYKKGTKINISVLSTDSLTDLTGNLGIDPEICVKFGDGDWKSLSYPTAGYTDLADDEGHFFSYRYDYEYEIKEEDYGQMSVHFSSDQRGYDSCQNMVTFDPAYSTEGEGYKPGIFADSIAPTGKITYVTNEDRSVTATVEFEEENITITNNEGKNTYTFTETGEFIFTFKDQAGNEGSAKAEIKNSLVSNPELKFKTLETKEESGKVYVKVGQDSTVASIKSDIDTAALAGKTVEIENLTEDGKIKTGSTITIDGNVQCVIVVSGDVDGDGKIDFIGDIIRANNYRLGLINIDVEQELASDIDDDGKVDFIKDLIRINNYRLGLIDSL